MRGRSSAGRAQRWQRWGQGFDPPRLHHMKIKSFQVESTKQKMVLFDLRFTWKVFDENMYFKVFGTNH